MLEGSILQQLKSALENTNRPLNLGVYYKNTLVALCHALEDCILVSGSQPLVITAFQRGKWYLQEAERYHDLAQKSRHVAIMAAPDTGFADHPTSKLPNVDLVALNPEDPVAQEWHLIILAPSYTAMVLCQELSEADYGVGGRPTIDLERKFYGFWTFEPARVEKTIDLAIAHINSYNPELAQQLKSHVQAIAQESAQVEPDDLNTIVSRVVDYLQTSEYSIKQIEHHQILDSNLVSNELQAFLRLGQLIDLADTGNPLAAAEVAAIAEIMGQLLNLPAWQVKRLRLASLLHRIAPQSVNVQYGEAPSCPLIPAAQVLRTMPRLSAIAQIINHFSEHWDGSGEPAGLMGETIPLESRILGLVADFQQRFTHLSQSHTREEALSTALAQCQQEQGKAWEPKLVDTLELLVRGMQQGLTLPVSPTKISSSMWLIDEERAEFGIRNSGVASG
ncbi:MULTISPECIES: DICT sensory domain-containing protein [Chroococcidiopsis]|jgi:DICT domain-containing protein|uniref:Putative sensor protein n=1 Tax=Chroococcidiopsis thermalis (strain PCC 7203) TaxID=251229 RepID=K9U5W5_CHRTP|nr:MULTISPECIES: DICT sensory domain-containing protein [Chroococcidiopsis]AFY89781.1 putative sensor protein [Chroococcidiopsis thermalis PCC 7203]URD49166.1 metal-dependent phosphohydrolase [Chroococcidiopsis sp. CCNUC1]